METAQGPVFLIPGQSQAADASSLVISPYVTDQIALSDRFQVLVGARFDSIDYEDDVDRDRARASRRSRRLLGAGLVAGAVAVALRQRRPRPSRRRRAGWSGSASPRRASRSRRASRPSCWSGKAQATLAVYELERENVAIPDRTGITRQTGSQRSRGVELELAAEPLPRLRTVLLLRLHRRGADPSSPSWSSSASIRRPSRRSTARATSGVRARAPREPLGEPALRQRLRRRGRRALSRGAVHRRGQRLRAGRRPSP